MTGDLLKGLNAKFGGIYFMGEAKIRYGWGLILLKMLK